MHERRFAELVHSLRAAARVERGGAGQGDLPRLCGQVVGFFDGNVSKAALWFRLPNPLLGDLSPRDMIRYGRTERLARFIDEALAENAGAAEWGRALPLR